MINLHYMLKVLLIRRVRGDMFHRSIFTSGHNAGSLDICKCKERGCWSRSLTFFPVVKSAITSHAVSEKDNDQVMVLNIGFICGSFLHLRELKRMAHMFGICGYRLRLSGNFIFRALSSQRLAPNGWVHISRYLEFHNVLHEGNVLIAVFSPFLFFPGRVVYMGAHAKLFPVLFKYRRFDDSCASPVVHNPWVQFKIRNPTNMLPVCL